jgi:zinc transporter 1
MFGHPVQTRASLVQTAQDLGFTDSSIVGSPINYRRSSEVPTETTPLLRGDVEAQTSEYRSETDEPEHIANHHTHEHEHEHDHEHDHDHGHGHGHGSMNMHALVLHVIGDALGNVGVISTGLIIWLTTWPLKYYCDPIISLVITVIIFSSALPLVKSASFILLQGVPATVSLPDLRNKIRGVSGVLSIHELHVWQLSESKAVASVHVWVSKDRDFMGIAADIRRVLHDFGIHSSAIQPEFYSCQVAREQELITAEETACLIPCAPNAFCNPQNGCCPPSRYLAEPPSSRSD